ncbi:MAG: chromosomal replication initiator protein DnaA [Clostridia bacterium]
MNSAQNVWAMAMPILAERLTPIAINAWFDDLVPVSFKDDVLILNTPNDLKKEVLETKFLSIIKEAFNDLFSCDIEVIINSGEQIIQEDDKENTKHESADYTFEQFIVGSSNKFAHAAAISVANSPANKFNPLFIYGQSGLGKTHLLNAIASVIKTKNKASRIVYIKGEDFTNELVSAIQGGDVQKFRDKYRMADLLLVDDIQFVAGKERTQEEFFHTFNALYESKKQIVLTSDRPPKEINTLEERLQTRFEWGLLADIQPPDYETRLAIISSKSNKLDFFIPPEICDYIARTIVSNVRQLEGTVKKMVALHELMGKPMGLELAEEAIRDVFRENPGLRPTPELILKEVAKYYSITTDKIASSNRSKEMVQPRQVAMYLVRNLTDYSLPEIGKAFSRDHTTVLHSIHKIEEYIKTTDDMKNIIEDLTKNIRNQ